MKSIPQSTVGLADRLRTAGLRPTRQRVALAELLFAAEDRHVTAETLYVEARAKGIPMVLATVYNTLNQFSRAGLLRQVQVTPERCYFDTNVSDHHHFFIEADGVLVDIPARGISVSGLPEAPDGTTVERVDVVVRLQR
jgi:Fur family iron response transcriptional regulator